MGESWGDPLSRLPMNSRSSILLALSTGMMVGLVALPFLPRKMAPVAPLAPQPSAAPAPAASSGATSLAAAKAACVESVDGFLGALRSGERTRYSEYLTDEALLGLGANQGLSIDGTGIEVFQVGEAEIMGGEAYVPVAMTIRGELQNMDLHLREAHGAWSIYGTSVDVGPETVMIDFEAGPEALGLPKDAVDDAPLELQGAAQQEPEAKEFGPLVFDGELPVVLEFEGFADRTDPQFTRVDVGVQNHSNKPVTRVQASFHYLDQAGAEIDAFPHSLSGPIGYYGQADLVSPGDEKLNNLTAFFVPEGTVDVRVEVQQVVFADGSVWPED